MDETFTWFPAVAWTRKLVRFDYHRKLIASKYDGCSDPRDRPHSAGN